MPEPIKVKCIYCKNVLELNEDSEATRVAGTDPHQQLRMHFFHRHSIKECLKHARATAWLTDMLAFRPASGELEARWTAALLALLNHYQSDDWKPDA